MTEKNQNIVSTESQSKSKSRNQRKLLPKLNANTNRTYSNSRYKKKEKETDITLEENNISNGKIKTSSNNVLTESIDFLKKIKEAKEIKDLEIIYKKWNNEKILSSGYKEDAIKIEIYNNKKETKENNKIYKKNYSEKNEEKKKMLEKLKLFKKQKEKRNNSNNLKENEDIKKIEKSMNRHLKMIYQKSDMILNEKFKIDNIKNDAFVEILEYIIDISKYHEKEIKVNNNNLLLPKEAIEYKDNSIIKILGYFGSEFALNNINVFIEKIPTNEKLRDITFKIISSGIATNILYKIKLDNDNYEFMFNEDIEKWFLFLDNIKRRISLIFNIPTDIIYIFGHNLYTFEAYLLIYNRKINNVEKVLKNFNLKAESTSLLNDLILSPSIFDINFCKNEDEWPQKNLVRGGKRYYPPYGWIGIALNIKDRYKNSNDKDKNIWLGKKNSEGEWPVAYHGIGKGNVFKKVLNILNSNLKEGPGQLYKYNLNVEKNRDKYNYCGEGVYLSPNIKEAMKYAESIILGTNNLAFKFVIMARVNPEKIRSPGGSNAQVDWILNGNEEEIRPYRLLIKIYEN